MKKDFLLRITESEAASDTDHKNNENELRESFGTQIREAIEGGKVWKIVIIEGGRSKNGNYYSPEVLKNSIKVFEGVKVFSHKFGDTLDHRPDELSDPYGFVGNQAGFINNVVFESTGEGRLIGDFHVTNSSMRDLLVNTWKEDKNQMPGFSVDIVGSGERRGDTNHVKEIKKAFSVDMVTHPSAGGQFERLVASMKEQNKEFKMNHFFKVMLSMAKSGIVKLKESIEKKTDEEIIGIIKKELNIGEADMSSGSVPLDKLQPLLTMDGDALKQALSEIIKACAADMQEAEDAKKKAAYDAEQKAKQVSENETTKESATFKEVKALKEELAQNKSLISLEGILAQETNLANESKDRIRESLKGKVFGDDVVHAKVKAEKEYIERVLESSGSLSTKMGYIQVDSTPGDKLQAALDLMVHPELASDEKYKDEYKGMHPFLSFREAIMRFDGLDIHKFLMATPSDKRRMKEATTANFTIALGDSMNKRMVREYQKFREREIWTKLVTEENFTNLNTQKLFRFGGFQDLDSIAEGGTYQETNTPTETNPTYTPFKKGNIFTLTEEMLINDDTGALRAFPSGMARAAIRTLSKFVFNLITGCDGSDNINIQTIYDGKTLYHNDHGGNLTPNAFSLSTFDAGVAAMMNQTEDTGSEDPIGIRAKYLLVSPTLRRTAWDATSNELVQANSNGGSIQNALKEYGIEPLTVPEGYLGFKRNAWFLIGDKNDAEGIRIGYHAGKKEPEILLQDNPQLGNVFTNDKITYRVKFRYGGAIVDYRPFFGGIVTT